MEGHTVPSREKRAIRLLTEKNSRKSFREPLDTLLNLCYTAIVPKGTKEREGKLKTNQKGPKEYDYDRN